MFIKPHIIVAWVLVFSSVLFSQESFFQSDAHTRALWRFNEGQGDTAFDSSFYGNHLKIGQPVSWGSDLGVNGLVFSDTSNTAAVENSSILNLFDEWVTLEVRFKINNKQSGFSYKLINYSPDYVLFLNESSFSSSFNSGNAESNQLDLDTNTWFVLGAQRNSLRNIVTLFFNDSLVGVGYSGQTDTHSDSLFIGGPTLSNVFIDEIRISDTARYVLTNHIPFFVDTLPNYERFVDERMDFYDEIYFRVQDIDGDTIYCTPIHSPSFVAVSGYYSLFNHFSIRGVPYDTGTFPVCIQASDNNGGYDTLCFNIIVTGTPTNQTPVFSTTASADTIIASGTSFSIPVLAIDPDADTVRYALLIAPDSMTIDSVTGVIQWTAGDTSDNEVSIQASDRKNRFDTLSFTLHVLRSNNAPTINSLPTTNVLAYYPWNYIVRATDSDSDPITCSLAISPAGMTLSKDTLRWTQNSREESDNPISIIVSDDRGLADTQSFSLHVIASSDSIEFQTWRPFDDTSIYETDTAVFWALPRSFHHSEAVFSYAWSMNGVPVCTTFYCTLFTTYTSVGRCTVSVAVTDGEFTIEQIWHVQIKNRGMPPAIVRPVETDSLFGDSTLAWTMGDPDIIKTGAKYTIELYRDSVFQEMVKAVDSLPDSVVILRDLLDIWDYPESTYIYWRVSAYDTTGYTTGFSVGLNRFFFIALDDIAVEKNVTLLPKVFELYQNSPNPFNPTTSIRIAMPKKCNAQLVIRDIRGRKVRSFVRNNLAPGYYIILWDGLDETGAQCPNGLYVYTLQAGTWEKSRKALFLK